MYKKDRINVSSRNFSWAILGIVLMGILPVIAIMLLAISGNADPTVITALIGVTTSAVTGLAGVMNPNKQPITDKAV